MPRYCQRSDLARALGGDNVMIELLDKDQDHVADDVLVEDVLDAGCNEIASYIAPAVDPDALSEPFPYVLVFKSASACAFYAWVRGSDGQAAPQNIVDGYNAAIAWAKDVGEKRAALVATPKPTLDPPAAVVDPDPDGTGVSIAGFKRGYR